MNNYRVKETDGKFYPQERTLFFFWDNIKLYDRVARDWFVKSIQDNLYDGTVEYLCCKDNWGTSDGSSPSSILWSWQSASSKSTRSFSKERMNNKKRSTITKEDQL